MELRAASHPCVPLKFHLVRLVLMLPTDGERRSQQDDGIEHGSVCRSSRQFVQQCPSVPEIRHVESFSKPIVDWFEQVMRFHALALTFP
jgi:hypothetical protein